MTEPLEFRRIHDRSNSRSKRHVLLDRNADHSKGVPGLREFWDFRIGMAHLRHSEERASSVQARRLRSRAFSNGNYTPVCFVTLICGMQRDKHGTFKSGTLNSDRTRESPRG